MAHPFACLLSCTFRPDEELHFTRHDHLWKSKEGRQACFTPMQTEHAGSIIAFNECLCRTHFFRSRLALISALDNGLSDGCHLYMCADWLSYKNWNNNANFIFLASSTRLQEVNCVYFKEGRQLICAVWTKQEWKKKRNFKSDRNKSPAHIKHSADM